MATHPDLPAAARLMEAARSLRLEAQALRRLSPPRRAGSSAAEADVDGDGRLLALRMLDPRLLPAAQWGSHLIQLSRVAAGATAVDGVRVMELPAETVPAASRGLGRGRFSFPTGIDGDAPPTVVLAQVNARLRSRFAAAESVSVRVTELDGMGRAGDNDAVVIRVGSLGQLLEVRVSSLLGSETVDVVNDLLAAAIAAAQDDLRRQIDTLLDQEGI